MKIRYSKRIDTTDHHALSPDRCRMRRSQPLADLGTPQVDAPLGCAIQTALPPATPFTTAEISLRFLRTVAAQSGTLTGNGRLIHAGLTCDTLVRT
jgi:hypothetical protein